MRRKLHTDAGHGWLAVKRQELIDLGVIDQISSYSYQRGQTVYLEEDCDLQRYLAALDSHGTRDKLMLVLTAHQDRSPIRNYERFTL